MKIPTNINLTNITNRDILESESIVLKDENVSLSFDTHEQYTIGKYVIEYAYILTEPNYEDINNYINTSYSINGSIEEEKNYYQYNNYTGKSSNFTLNISDTINTNCNDENCALCFTNYTCITCKYNYTINSNIKTCFPNLTEQTTILKESTTILKEPTTIINIQTTILNITTTFPHISTTVLLDIPSTSPNITTTVLDIPITFPKKQISTTFPSKSKKTIITTIKNVPIMTTSLSVNPNQNCTKKEIFNNQCKKKLSSEQIGDIYNELKSNITANTSEIIETENVIFQLSTLEEQKNNNNPNVSSIDLGECEQRLKEQEGLSDEDNLIILKTDIKNEHMFNMKYIIQ